MREKLSATILSVVMLSSLLLSALMVQGQEYTARISGHWPPKHQSAIHAQMFADEITKRSDGRLKVEFFPSKQLGFGIREVMGAVTSGAVEMGGVVGVVSFPSINKNFNVASFPGMFDSYEEQRGFFMESPMGKNIWSDITSKTNSKLIMYNPVGPVMTLSAKRELTGVDAMKGLKARRLIPSITRPWYLLYSALVISSHSSLRLIESPVTIPFSSSLLMPPLRIFSSNATDNSPSLKVLICNLPRLIPI